MKQLYDVYFEDRYSGERIAPAEGKQRVEATDARDAMIRAGAMLAVQPDAVAIVREVRR